MFWYLASKYINTKQGICVFVFSLIFFRVYFLDILLNKYEEDKICYKMLYWNSEGNYSEYKKYPGFVIEPFPLIVIIDSNTLIYGRKQSQTR